MLDIRLATRQDVPVLLTLIRQLASFERKSAKAMVAEEDLVRDGYGPQPKFRAVIARWVDQTAGYASFFYFYSTFQGRPALFLEDLFVLEQFRGHGIGKALLSTVAKLAIQENCFGLRWEVLEWNREAIEFYERLGATSLDERKVIALENEALRRMAAAIKTDR
ncbi:MAG: GNAT family N-acetyltransferase [Acidobacteria bacterium]|nr:GNAT family N-acetyltransferase [Acidobacteriota bacterium]